MTNLEHKALLPASARLASQPRPIRVLHVVPRFCLGGMEQGVAKLVNGLSLTKVASAICSLDDVEPPIPTLNRGVEFFALSRRPGHDPRAVLRLVRLLRRLEPDVVHSHSWGSLVESFVAARVASVPRFVHGEHGTMELRTRNLRAQRWLWQRANQVLAVSSRLADAMAAHTGFPRERIRTIHNGTDVRRFKAVDRPQARLALELTEWHFAIGTIGRLVAVKDHARLLEALAALQPRLPAAVLLIAGEGPLRSELESKARALGLQRTVRFLGTRTDVETVLAGLDVYVQSSESEGLPNTVIEAMAAGVAVVATAVGGTDELITHGVNGVLVPPRDSKAIAQAVIELADDTAKRQRFAEAGRARAETDFNLCRMLSRYEQLYMELAEASILQIA